MHKMRVLFRREAVEGENAGEIDVSWVAVGLEHDIVAQGSTIFEAYFAFKQTVRAEARSLASRNRTFADIPPSPIEYHHEYERVKHSGLVTDCPIPAL